MTSSTKAASANSASALDVLYNVAAGTFFAASAYAQLNDPDPEVWVTGYLFGGVFLNVLVLALRGPQARWWLRALAAAFAVGVACVMQPIAARVATKLDFSLPPRQLGWSFLELEEGREIAGLLLLLLHIAQLQTLCRPAAATAVPDGSASGRGVGGVVAGVVAASCLAGAAYLWVFYQPLMNRMENKEHCKGQF